MELRRKKIICSQYKINEKNAFEKYFKTTALNRLLLFHLDNFIVYEST